ncbi:chemokine-like factor [Antennarius striatus]|uniref:chemokine-like factor n=1 Tax=Antennarius striatus TaxID=241820 RepID=UPI0035B0293A
MSENPNKVPTLGVDAAFLRSRRGILKLAEMGALLVAFVCFTVAFGPKYIAAAALEFLITSLLVLLYALRLNKRLTFFFWPLIDLFNSVFAAVYFVVLSLVAVITHTVAGTVVGGVAGLVAAGLLFVDGYILLKNITFNKRRSEAQNESNG